MHPLFPPIDTADGQFRDGNPATGEPGTIVSAAWLNRLQQAARGTQSELLALLSTAGIAVDEQDQQQVLKAIRALSGQSLAMHEKAEHPHPQYATTTALEAHSKAENPHPQYATTTSLQTTATDLQAELKQHSVLDAHPHAQYILDTDGRLQRGVAVGTITAFATSWAPEGYLKANGAAVSRTAYASLFAHLGTHYGAGDGYSTFNLPDLRGEFVRGWDDGRGVDVGRGFGGWQNGSEIYLRTEGISGAPIDLQYNDDVLYALSQSWDRGYFSNPTVHLPATITSPNGVVISPRTSGVGVRVSKQVIEQSASRGLGLSGTRPRNIALLYCIKY